MFRYLKHGKATLYTSTTHRVVVRWKIETTRNGWCWYSGFLLLVIIVLASNPRAMASNSVMSINNLLFPSHHPWSTGRVVNRERSGSSMLWTRTPQPVEGRGSGFSPEPPFQAYLAQASNHSIPNMWSGKPFSSCYESSGGGQFILV